MEPKTDSQLVKDYYGACVMTLLPPHHLNVKEGPGVCQSNILLVLKIIEAVG